MARDDRSKQVRMVMRFEYLSWIWPSNREPSISPSPRPTSARRQFFCFVWSDQFDVFGFVDMVSVISGTKTPAYIAQLIAVHIMKGIIFSILFDNIRLAVSKMSSLTEVLDSISLSFVDSRTLFPILFNYSGWGKGRLSRRKNKEDAMQNAVITM